MDQPQFRLVKPSPKRIAILILAVLSHRGAQAAGKDDAGGTLGLYLESDLFSGTDQHYTSGFKMSWSSHDLEQLGDSRYASPFIPMFNLLPYSNEKNCQKNLFFALGQNIDTPVNPEAYDPIEDDRPYAGWLYLGLGVVWKDKAVKNSLVLDIGDVGTWSYAEQTQRVIHGLRARTRKSPARWSTAPRSSRARTEARCSARFRSTRPSAPPGPGGGSAAPL